MGNYQFLFLPAVNFNFLFFISSKPIITPFYFGSPNQLTRTQPSMQIFGYEDKWIYNFISLGD